MKGESSLFHLLGAQPSRSSMILADLGGWTMYTWQSREQETGSLDSRDTSYTTVMPRLLSFRGNWRDTTVNRGEEPCRLEVRRRTLISKDLASAETALLTLKRRRSPGTTTSASYKELFSMAIISEPLITGMACM